jgi:hypothetical protein
MERIVLALKFERWHAAHAPLTTMLNTKRMRFQFDVILVGIRW